VQHKEEISLATPFHTAAEVLVHATRQEKEIKGLLGRKN
jgi:hypothetical protein